MQATANLILNAAEFIAQPYGDKDPESYFVAVAGFIHKCLGVKQIVINQVANTRMAKTVAFMLEGRQQDEMVYDLRGTPGEAVLTQGAVFHPRDVRAIYPNDETLEALEIESYAGVAIRASSSKPLGVISVLDCAPLNDAGTISAFLQILATRLGGILEKNLDMDAVEKSERELALLESAIETHSIVSRTDCAGTITYVNEKFSEISGYSAEELVGSNHRLVNSGFHGGDFFKRMWQTISSGNEWHGTLRNKAKGGSFYWVKTTIIPEFDDTHTIVGYLSVRTDITDQVEKTRATRERLSAQERLLSVISHEFRTPLNAIVGFIQLMELADDLNDLKTVLPDMKSASREMNQKIENLLWLGADESAGQEPASEFSLTDLLEDIAHSFSVEAERKNVTVTVSAPSQVTVVQPYSPLQTILANLLSNAIKFSPNDGAVTLLACSSDPSSFEISVEDHGQGFSGPSEAVLEAFERGGHYNSIVPGLGIGLTISSRLCRFLNIDLVIASKPGQGTKVTLKKEGPPPS